MNYIYNLSILLLGIIVLGTSAEAEEHSSNHWNKLFAFGDSYSDSGAGYVDGDGPTAVVYAARELGIPFTYATDPDAGSKGLNYAVSGARTGESEGEYVKDAFLGYGMQNQVSNFAAGVQSGAISFDPKHTLFFLAGGLNDRSMETAETFSNMTLLVRRLYVLGARHFFIAILPTQIQSFSIVAERLNPALKALPEALQQEFPDATMQSSHWGEFFDTVMREPVRYGITNTTEPCAGRAIFDQDTTPQGDPATYYFYHSNHPSTAVHQHVGRMLAREFRSATLVKDTIEGYMDRGEVRVDYYGEALRLFGTASSGECITENRPLQGNRIIYHKNGNLYPDEDAVKSFALDYGDKQAGDFSVRFDATDSDPVDELGFMPGPYQKTWMLSKEWTLNLRLKAVGEKPGSRWPIALVDAGGNRAEGHLGGLPVQGKWHQVALPLAELETSGDFDFTKVVACQLENPHGRDGKLWFDDIRFVHAESGQEIGVTDKAIGQRRAEAAASRADRVEEAFRDISQYTPETLRLDNRHVYWRDLLNPHFARLWLGQELEQTNAELRAILSSQDPEIRKLYELDDHWSLYLTPTLIQMYYTFGSKATRKPGRLEQSTEEALLELLWERTKVKNDIVIARQSTWWMAGSENHDINAKVANLLSSQIFMNEPAYADRVYPDLGYGSGYGYGKPGLARETGGRASLKDGGEYNASDHYQAWVAFWDKWFVERARRGLFVEVNSPTYQLYSLGFLQCVLDLCEDPGVRSKARKFFDLVWLDWSQDQIGGMRGGAKTRSYLPASSYGAMTQFSKFLLGGPGDACHGFFELLLSDYELPAIVWELALDREGLGSFAYLSRRPGEEENAWPRPLGNERTLLCDTQSRFLRYSWVTPDYIMGTQMDHPGAVHSHLSIDRRHQSVVFAGDPWCRVIPGPLYSGERGRIIGTSTFDPGNPDSWKMGVDHIYRSVQFQSVLITQQARNLNRVSPEWFPDYTMENKPYGIWFQGEFDQFEERDGWIFLAKGNVYLAVRVVVAAEGQAGEEIRLEQPDGTKVTPVGENGYEWNGDHTILHLKNRHSPMILEAGRKADYATLEDFQADILDNPIRMYATLGPSEAGFFVLKYTGCGEDAQEIVYNAANSEIPTVGGEYINYAYPKLFDSPYLDSDYESGVVKASKGECELIIDFNN